MKFTEMVEVHCVEPYDGIAMDTTYMSSWDNRPPWIKFFMPSGEFVVGDKFIVTFERVTELTEEQIDERLKHDV